ncbi:TPA: transferrin-binding protein-like solute binding protein [Haemophilus influenzae]
MKSVPLITGGLSFLLSACSGGGGSFDVDDVSNPSSSKPRYQDDTSNQRTKSNLQKLSIPSLGGGMKLVAQNFTGAKEPSFLNGNDYMIFSSLSTIEEDVKNNNENKDIPIGSIKEPDANSQDSNSQKYVYSGLYYIENWKDFSKFKEKEKKAYSGYYGYAFYYGNKTATDLPVSGVAKYKGIWNFITATENGKRYSLFKSGSGAYSKRSAISEDIDDIENNSSNGDAGLISEFSVNFGTKKLTGELYYNKRKTHLNNKDENRKHILYNLEADVYSNRFRGKAKPTEKDSTDHPFTSEGTLEGGFYGPNAEELGGKFLADDKRVFGVFSAKENPENKKLSKETLIDGKLTTFSKKTTDTTTDATTNTAANTTTNAKTDEKNFKTEDISSFGEADYLLIDNYPIPLFPENTSDFATSKHHNIGNKRYKVEACCNNLSYVKFGMYYEDPLKEEEKDKEKNKEKNKEKEEDKEKQATESIDTYYQFLLGLRTASSEIPKMGNVEYRGNWFGYISDGTTSYSPSGDKERKNNAVAEFNVNFVNKKLTGTLKRHDNQNTVFSIDATFNNGNDFTGKATAKDLVIDGKSTQATSKVNFTATVKGAFYGPNATELGGYFTYNGKNPTATNSPTVSSPSNSANARAAVVFGAKKQVETTNK